jgi:hypothetical protein
VITQFFRHFDSAEVTETKQKKQVDSVHGGGRLQTNALWACLPLCSMQKMSAKSGQHQTMHAERMNPL